MLVKSNATCLRLILSFAVLLLLPIVGMARPSKLIEHMTWIEVNELVHKTRVVIVPLGTPAKEHGPHLPMNTDLIVSDYLRDRVLEKLPNVIAAPTMTYQYYSTFTDYPGTISMSYQTALGVVLDTCRLLYKQGFKKIYILNTGIRTLDVLKVAKVILTSEGIQMDYLESKKLMSKPEMRKLVKQARGTHADEVETSMMLYIAPEVVNMTKAKKDDNPKAGLPNSGFTPDPNNKTKTYSPSGTWGDPTLASKQKGKVFTEALVTYLIDEINNFSK